MADLSTFQRRYNDLVQFYVQTILPEVLPTLSPEDAARATELQTQLQDSQVTGQEVVAVKTVDDAHVKLLERKLSNMQTRYFKAKDVCPPIDKKAPGLYDKLKAQTAQDWQYMQTVGLFAEQKPPPDLLKDRTRSQEAVQFMYDKNVPFELIENERTVEEVLECLKSDENVAACFDPKKWSVLESTSGQVISDVLYEKKCAEVAMQDTPEGRAEAQRVVEALKLRDEGEKVLNTLAVNVVASFFLTDKTNRVDAFFNAFPAFDLEAHMDQVRQRVQNTLPGTTDAQLNQSMAKLLNIPNLFMPPPLEGGAEPESPPRPPFGLSFSPRISPPGLTGATEVARPAAVVPQPAAPKNTLADWKNFIATQKESYTAAKARLLALPENANKPESTVHPRVAPFGTFRTAYDNRTKLKFFQVYESFYKANLALEQAKQLPYYEQYVSGGDVPPAEYDLLNRWDRTIKNFFLRNYSATQSFSNVFKGEKLATDVCNMELRALYTLLNDEVLERCNFTSERLNEIVQMKQWLRSMFDFVPPAPGTQMDDRELLKEMENFKKRAKAESFYTMLTPIGVFDIVLPPIQPDEVGKTQAETSKSDIELLKSSGIASRLRPTTTIIQPVATVPPSVQPVTPSVQPLITGGITTPTNSLLRALHPDVKAMTQRAHQRVPRDPLLHALYLSAR